MFVSLEQALTKGHGAWRSFSCPDPDHDDVNPSARVNVATGRWVCMVCGTRGKAEKYDPDPDLVLEHAMDLIAAGPEPFAEGWLDQFDSGPVPAYWLSRFPEGVCRLYRFGWDFVHQVPCYPLRDNSGRPIGVVRRNDGEGPKYLYPKGRFTSEILFGMHELAQTDHLVVVEGATTAAAVRACGFEAVGTYGARLYPAQLDLIVALEPKVVVLAYDQDQAGWTGSSAAIRALKSEGIVAERLVWSKRWNDLDDVPENTRSNLLSRRIDPVGLVG